MESLIADVRYAARSLWRSPGFTAVAVLTLGLGIGANSAIFTLVDAVLLRRPAGVVEPNRLVSIYTSDFSSGDFGTSSYPDFEAIRAERQVFASVAAYSFQPVSLSTGEQAEMLNATLVSAEYFSLLGLVPGAGRLIGPDDVTAPGTSPVAVVSHGMWRTRFGGEPGAVGRTVRVNGREFTVIGVTPPGFRGLQGVLENELWIPITMDPALDADDLTSMGNRSFLVVGRLADGVTAEQAQARLTALARSRFEQFPDWWRTVRGDGRKLTLRPESYARVPPQGRAVVVTMSAMLMIVVGLVLLIACANIANLLLARATGRAREIAVRLSLGATRRRLVQQLLTESVLIALLGGVAGLAAAGWVADLIVRLRPPVSFPIRLAVETDARVLWFTLGVSLLTGIVFGLLPALRASRPQLVAELKGDVVRRRAGSRYGLRDLLVVGQLAVSLVLLVGAALFLRSLGRAQAVDPGFDAENVVLMSFALEAQGYNQARTRAFYDQLLERARALPGVEGATLATSVPLGGSYGRRGTRIEGYTPGPGESTEINWNVVGADYFRVMRVPVMRGRAFTGLDRDGAPLVVVINEAFARRYWPGEDPIGKGISVTGAEGPFRPVVGVVADGKYRSLAEDPLPYMYLPFGQQYRAWMTLHVRSAGDPGPVLARLRQEVQSLDPNLPIVNPTTLKEQIGIAVLPQRLAATLLSAFGVLAVLLAVIGLYGVMAYAVSQRTREFGIRTALGATWRDVVRQVVGEGLLLAGTGLVIGLAVAAAVTRFARAFLFDVSPLDPVAFGAVTLLLLGVTAVASYVPARRATRVDPMVALRYE